jgi:hypothetical protein
MVFNATFNNISDTSWWSVLLVDETGEPGENHRTVANPNIVDTTFDVVVNLISTLKCHFGPVGIYHI